MRIHKNVNDWERIGSIALGLGLVAVALKSRRFRTSLATTGLGFVSRGLSGFCLVNAALGRERTPRAVAPDTTRKALAGSGGLRLAESIRIHRTPHEVYDYWRDLQNLAGFMSHIHRIDVTGSQRSHWVVRGPAGVTVEWNAQIINERRPDLIAWQSVGNSDVATAGSVHFTELADGGTQVDVVLQYAPPAGKVGAGLAALFGSSAGSMLRDDLRRLKVLLESDRSRRPAESRLSRVT